MKKKESRIIIGGFGALFAITGGLIWHWGNVAGFLTFGILGCIMLFGALLFSDENFERMGRWIRWLG